MEQMSDSDSEAWENGPNDDSNVETDDETADETPDETELETKPNEAQENQNELK